MAVQTGNLLVLEKDGDGNYTGSTKPLSRLTGGDTLRWDLDTQLVGDLNLDGDIDVSGTSSFTGDATFVGDLIVQGRAYVDGGRMQVDGTVSILKDNLLHLNSGPGGLSDGGILVDRYYTAWGAADESGVATDLTVISNTIDSSIVEFAHAGASAVDDFYNTWNIAITGGTGQGQARTITDYVGATKRATLDREWETAPDATSTYGLWTTAQRFAGFFWDESADEMVYGFVNYDPGTTAISVDGYAAARFGAAAVTGGLTLTTSGITMTGLDIGGGAAEIGDVYGDGFIRLGESGAAPDHVANKGFVYTLDIGGATELHFTDSAGNDVQITSGGALNAQGVAGTTNLTYTINTDAADATDEDPALILLGGDGVAENDDDLVRATIKQDSTAEVVYFTLERNRHGAGYAQIAPTFEIGLPGAIANLTSSLIFNSGSGAMARLCTLALANSEFAIGGDAGLTAINLGTIAYMNAGAYVKAAALTISDDGSFSQTSGTFAYNVAASAFTVDAVSMSLDATTASNLTVTGAGQDLTVSAAGGSLVLSASEAVANAVQITASDAAGGIDMNFGTGGLAIDGTDGGALSIDAIGAPSNISLAATADADDLTIAVTGAYNASLVLSSAGTGTDAIDINATAGGIDIDASGAIDILAGGAFSLDGTGASNVTATSGNLTLSTITSGSLILTGVALVDINAGADLDIDVTGSVDILASTTFSIDGTGASNVTATSGDLTISTATSGNVVLTAAGFIDANSDISMAVAKEHLEEGYTAHTTAGPANNELFYVTSEGGNLAVSQQDCTAATGSVAKARVGGVWRTGAKAVVPGHKTQSVLVQADVAVAIGDLLYGSTTTKGRVQVDIPGAGTYKVRVGVAQSACAGGANNTVSCLLLADEPVAV